jgi:RNA polymerase sigma-70 factor (ECF subfamily)
VGVHRPASRLAASVAATTHLPGSSRTDRLRLLRASLDPEDRTLLALRIDRALEWDEVAAVLSTDASPVNAAALRKRFERLKAKLARLAREQGLID